MAFINTNLLFKNRVNKMFLKNIIKIQIHPLKNREPSHLTTGSLENPDNLEGHPSAFIYDQVHSVIQFPKWLCWSHLLAVLLSLQMSVTSVWVRERIIMRESHHQFKRALW